MAQNENEAILDVAVIGAGIAALAFAIGLKRDLPQVKYRLFEKDDEVGGVWRANSYPGCACDVRVHVYSQSTDPNPNWATTHAGREEILNYWKGIARKYELLPNIQFNSQVAGAEWNESEQLWYMNVKSSPGSPTIIRARSIVSALGALEVPHYPSIPGLSGFKGHVFHSARWNQDVTLQGKKVVVIGSGTSAAQILPSIAKEEGIQVTQFLRSPVYVWVTGRGAISKSTEWIFNNLPLVLYLYRALCFLQLELFWCLASFPPTNRLTRVEVVRYMKKHVPEKYQEKMIAQYPLVCKRTIFDVGYLESLHRPNVALVFGQPKEVTPDTVITQSGEEIAADVIITATGFENQSFPIPIRGKEGITIQEYYDSPRAQGPQAYRGTTIPGFPNFFMFTGPNIQTGHSSATFFNEVQTDYILQLLRPILSQDETRITSLSPTHEATDAYNIMLQKWLAKSLWTGCASEYRVNRSGKNTSIFPGPALLYWWWMRKPIWTDYEVVRAGDGGSKTD